MDRANINYSVSRVLPVNAILRSERPQIMCNHDLWEASGQMEVVVHRTRGPEWAQCDCSDASGVQCRTYVHMSLVLAYGQLVCEDCREYPGSEIPQT